MQQRAPWSAQPEFPPQRLPPAGPILAQRRGGLLLPLLTSTWGTALMASMAGLSAPEAGAMLEGIGASAGAALGKAQVAAAPAPASPAEMKEE